MEAPALIERLGRAAPGGWLVSRNVARQRTTRRSIGGLRDPVPAGSRRAVALAHRVTDATEIWLFNAGGPLELRVVAPPGPVVVTILGLDAAVDHRPQAIVPTGAWQAAHPLGAWTLVSCIVVPAFEFSSFELAPEGWEPEV